MDTTDRAQQQSEAPKKPAWRWWRANNNSTNSTSTRIANDVKVEAAKTASSNNMTPDTNGGDKSSLAPSSLIVHCSIHSRESEDISTTSIKSKAYASAYIKPQEGDIPEDPNTDGSSPSSAHYLKPDSCANSDGRDEMQAAFTPTSSLLARGPSVTSSTVPVYNYDPNRRRNLEMPRFASLKSKIIRWVNNKN